MRTSLNLTAPSRLLAAAALTALALGSATTAQASPSPASVPPHASGDSSPELRTHEARDRAAHQDEAALRRTVAEVTERLGRDTAGTFLQSDGDLVVTVTTPAGARAVRAAGLEAKTVDDTGAALDRLLERLNRQAERHDAGSVQGWRVDVPSNSVVVTLTADAQDPVGQRFTAWARGLEGDVTFERVSAERAPTPTESIYGGLEYWWSTATGRPTCSTGFNAVDASNRNVIVTAGHCLTTRPTLNRGGYQIGTTRSFAFPSKDYGVFNNNYPSYWVPKPWVYQYNGYAQYVRGTWANPPIGATVCKSGRTTGWTCGVLKATNQTVNYGNGQYVYGLVRHTACVEQGDSGGSNISSGGYALGLTSGASLSGGKCLSKVGQQNVSWYQPIGPALAANGLRILVQP